MTKKKMMLPFLSQSKSLDSKLPSFSTSPPWPFPTCGNIRTLSCRDVNNKVDDSLITFNSAFLNAENEQTSTPLDDSFFTISSSSRSFSTLSDESRDPLETVIRGLRSDRLFFEPERSSSLLLRELEPEPEPKEQVEDKVVVGEYKESELLSMESKNPYEDFKSSMEEMVQAHGLKDWQGLEELLGCYLKVNGKNNHGYIVGAFIDLLVSLSYDASTSSISTSTNTNTNTTITSSSSYSNYSSPSSPLSLPSSSLTIPCLSSILGHCNDGHDDDHVDDHVDVDVDVHISS